MTKIQTLKGFRDFLPAQVKQRQWLYGIMQDVAEAWGYLPIETPTLEPLELFAGEIGEDEKLFFKFTDAGDRQVALRYDQTVPTCRFIANNSQHLTFPFRRYQFQPVFRAEKPQKGRYREFFQFDIDIFGISSPLADAETIALTLATYQAIGFSSITIDIASRRLMQGMPYEAIVAIDKLAKIGKDGVIEVMVKNGITLEQAKNYMAQVDTLKPDEELNMIFKYLKSSGFASESYRFEPTLARSFSYSDGPIWEIKLPEYPSGSLGGGERYDGMMKRITGQDIPATGIAYGFDRTLEAALSLGLIPDSTKPSPLLIATTDSSVFEYALSIASQLRSQHIPCQTYPDPAAKLDKQLKFAHKVGLPFALILGPDEAKANTVTLKDFHTRVQTTSTLEEIISLIKS